jgi:phosphoribosylformylglycinamidine synthase I
VRFGVVRFPGTCDDLDALQAARRVGEAEVLWHGDADLKGVDAVIVPGGFSYGDYLRCGAIARFSPVMPAVVKESRDGKLVIGICNGFQILCEIGLLPGALVRNRSLHFVCEMVTTRVEVAHSLFTRGCQQGTLLRLPVAHGEGCFFADEATLRELNERQQVILRYATADGRLDSAANPNGSIENIAGICNREGNVFGLMPHPDRACELRLGSADGAKIFHSMMETIEARRARAA